MVNDWRLPAIEHPDPKIATLLGILEDGTREWKDELGTVQRSDFGRRISPTGPSIGSILVHIAVVEVYWLGKFVCGATPPPDLAVRLELPDSDVDAYAWADAPDWDAETYLSLLSDVRAWILAEMRGQTDLSRVIERQDGKSFSVGWVIGHVIQHDSYHGGQAVQLHQHWMNLDGRI